HETSVTRLLTEADSLRTANKLEDAKAIYQSVLKLEKTNIHAFAGIGKIAIAQKAWSEAGAAFQKVLDSDSENREANYYKGISYRETGKFKALLLRKLDWNKSEQHFDKVIERDSLYQDVIFQLAILERYRENYIEAIQLGQRQIQLRPELLEPEVKLFRLYRFYITHTRKNPALDWLQKQNWDHAIYAIGEKLRRENELIKADSVLQHLANKPSPTSRQPAYLSLARIYYEKKDAAEAEKYYWRAVNEISDAIDADLVFEDLKYIITDQELQTYRSLHTTKAKKDFFKKLWLSRNPTPAASVNYRLAEHYRRMIYAEKYYEYDGFRSWFNNPDKLGYLEFTESYDLNEEFHDKGLIYIRHGNPSERVATVNENSPSNESWLYYQTQFNPRLTFHFLVDNNSIGYWRLTPFISDPALLEDRLTWDNIYYQMLRATDLERLSMIQEMAEISRESVTVGLATDRHTWEKKIKSLEVPFSISTFRGKRDRTILEICYAISLSDIAKEAKKKSKILEFENGFVVHNLAWDEVEKKEDRIQVPFPISGTESFLDVYRFEVTPDSYRFAFYARPKEGNFLGGWKYEKRVADYSSSRLGLSDIELATKIEPTTKDTKFKKNGLLVIPNPTRLFSTKTPINVYFEIYQLSQDATGKTSFAIDYTLTLLESGKKGILGLFRSGGKSSISTQIDREGDNEFSVEYLAIDASQVRPGEYNLEIIVTDRLTGTFAKKAKRIALN
ncbi:GWxTD domain-containing protein, partial [candidate division KSB1 bacterium]|nr:GWxTD domain-containing protein [candidate division KSB1 bacterium]